MPSWDTSEVFPWSSSGARTTLAPHTAPRAWCPRQTPSMGWARSAQASIIAMDTPASSGVPGPGGDEHAVVVRALGRA